MRGADPGTGGKDQCGFPALVLRKRGIGCHFLFEGKGEILKKGEKKKSGQDPPDFSGKKKKRGEGKGGLLFFMGRGAGGNRMCCLDLPTMKRGRSW